MGLVLEECPKDLREREYEIMSANMILSGPSETEETEAFAGTLEILKFVQAVVVSTINFHPRGPIVSDLDDPRLEITTPRTSVVRGQ